ncbi:MFS transporter [Corynebacterium capitovis]|uniref:MFS transporter n=1 Tax=Corynebacterium capitovis TaxID=131081 RepID=UPI0006891631|nr:MFS transporter [Corynebacterium capitovis]
MSFAAFVYVTFEMFSVGLISPMAADLGVTEGRIGLLMTVYAGIVAAVTIPLMEWTKYLDRKPLFLATLLFLLLGVALQATAPNYWWLAAGRVTAALTHGVFWSMVNPMAARISPPGHTGKAVAAVSLGSTVALVLGSPLSTFVGGFAGWRVATWMLGGLVVASLAVAVWVLPPLPASEAVRATRHSDARSPLPSLVIFLALAVTAGFCAYTYLGLTIETTSGHALVAPGLSLYGLLGFAGVALAGRFADSRLLRINVVPALLLVIAAALGLIALGAEGTVAVALTGAYVIVLGVGLGALPTAATTLFLFAGRNAPDRASALYVVTFQVGIAAGSAVGAVFVDAGLLPGTLAATAALSAAAAAVLTWWSRPILR